MASKTFLKKRVTLDFIIICLLEISIREKHWVEISMQENQISHARIFPDVYLRTVLIILCKRKFTAYVIS